MTLTILLCLCAVWAPHIQAADAFMDPKEFMNLTDQKQPSKPSAQTDAGDNHELVLHAGNTGTVPTAPVAPPAAPAAAQGSSKDAAPSSSLPSKPKATMEALRSLTVDEKRRLVSEFRPLEGTARHMLRAVAHGTVKGDFKNLYEIMNDGLTPNGRNFSHKSDSDFRRKHAKRHRRAFVTTLADMKIKGEISQEQMDSVIAKIHDAEGLSGLQKVLAHKKDEKNILLFQLGQLLTGYLDYQHKTSPLTQTNLPAMLRDQGELPDFFRGGAGQQLSLEQSGEIVRAVMKAGGAVGPLTKTMQGQSRNLSTNDKVSMALGGAALAAQLGHQWATHNDVTLTPEELHALAYFNKRHGVPQEVKDYISGEKIRAGLQGALAVGGTVGALASENHKLPIFNAASIADSLIQMYGRHKRAKLMKQIKKMVPLMQEELRQAPPTEEELMEDQFSAMQGTGSPLAAGMGMGGGMMGGGFPMPGDEDMY
jgi:hypothetical protein